MFSNQQGPSKEDREEEPPDEREDRDRRNIKKVRRKSFQLPRMVSVKQGYRRFRWLFVHPSTVIWCSCHQLPNVINARESIKEWQTNIQPHKHKKVVTDVKATIETGCSVKTTAVVGNINIKATNITSCPPLTKIYVWNGKKAVATTRMCSLQKKLYLEKHTRTVEILGCTQIMLMSMDGNYNNPKEFPNNFNNCVELTPLGTSNQIEGKQLNLKQCEVTSVAVIMKRDYLLLVKAVSLTEIESTSCVGSTVCKLMIAIGSVIFVLKYGTLHDFVLVIHETTKPTNKHRKKKLFGKMSEMKNENEVIKKVSEMINGKVESVREELEQCIKLENTVPSEKNVVKPHLNDGDAMKCNLPFQQTPKEYPVKEVKPNLEKKIDKRGDMRDINNSMITSDGFTNSIVYIPVDRESKNAIQNNDKSRKSLVCYEKEYLKQVCTDHENVHIGYQDDLDNSSLYFEDAATKQEECKDKAEVTSKDVSNKKSRSGKQNQQTVESLSRTNNKVLPENGYRDYTNIHIDGRVEDVPSHSSEGTATESSNILEEKKDNAYFKEHKDNEDKSKDLSNKNREKKSRTQKQHKAKHLPRNKKLGKQKQHKAKRLPRAKSVFGWKVNNLNRKHNFSNDFTSLALQGDAVMRPNSHGKTSQSTAKESVTAFVPNGLSISNDYQGFIDILKFIMFTAVKFGIKGFLVGLLSWIPLAEAIGDSSNELETFIGIVKPISVGFMMIATTLILCRYLLLRFLLLISGLPKPMLFLVVCCLPMPAIPFISEAQEEDEIDDHVQIATDENVQIATDDKGLENPNIAVLPTEETEDEPHKLIIGDRNDVEKLMKMDTRNIDPNKKVGVILSEKHHLNSGDYRIVHEYDYNLTYPMQYAAGGYGDVSVLKDNVTHYTFVEKRIQLRRVSEQEVLVALRLANQDFIPELTGVYWHKETLHILMEFCEGESLRHRKKSRPYSDEELSVLLFKLLCGLQYFHTKHNTVLNDLKGTLTSAPSKPVKQEEINLTIESVIKSSGSPKVGFTKKHAYDSITYTLRGEFPLVPEHNVVLKSKDDVSTIRFIDFGAALSDSYPWKTGGDTAVMVPVTWERIAKEGKVTELVKSKDLWNVGTIIYFMLTGGNLYDDAWNELKRNPDQFRESLARVSHEDVPQRPTSLPEQKGWERSMIKKHIAKVPGDIDRGIGRIPTVRSVLRIPLLNLLDKLLHVHEKIFTVEEALKHQLFRELKKLLMTNGHADRYSELNLDDLCPPERQTPITNTLTVTFYGKTAYYKPCVKNGTKIGDFFKEDHECFKILKEKAEDELIYDVEGQPLDMNQIIDSSVTVDVKTITSRV